LTSSVTKAQPDLPEDHRQGDQQGGDCREFEISEKRLGGGEENNAGSRLDPTHYVAIHYHLVSIALFLKSEKTGKNQFTLPPKTDISPGQSSPATKLLQFRIRSGQQTT
jgi:hypothetical protein